MNELFSELMEIVQPLVARTSYPLVVDYIDEDANEVLRAVQLCREKKPKGILFLGGDSRHFAADFGKIDIPCVLVTNDATELGFPNLSSVYVDDREAARCAMDSLLALGHGKIAVVGGDRFGSDTGRLRFEGCMDAIRAHGIDFQEGIDYQGARFSYQDGYDATQRLLDAGQGFTALFAVADVIAIGAIRALRDNGLRVPEDVSVMGFDGLPLGSFLVPKLTTVAQPVRELAHRSVEILIAGIQGGTQAVHESVPFTLCQRESTRRIGE